MINYGPGQLSGVDDRKDYGAVQQAMTLTEDIVPTGFPINMWNSQQLRYNEGWEWFNGTRLNELAGHTPSGKPVYMYPLKINPVRIWSRAHASMLMGETQDTPTPLIKPIVTPRASVHGDQPTEEMKNLANISERLFNLIWEQSNGRSIQMEAAVLSQFLGGSFFQVQYVPDDPNLIIPIKIKFHSADFVLPIYQSDDMWTLLEAFVVYRIDAKSAMMQYGVEVSNDPYATYIEHWTQSSVSVYINGEPIPGWDNQPNPFGFVPFVYIPHQREGNFYGSTIIEDLRGLMIEYNSRASDIGDAIRLTVRRRRWVRNIGKNLRRIVIPGGGEAIDLGQQRPGTDSPPDMIVEDPASMNDSLASWPEQIWNMMQRAGNTNDIQFGDDDVGHRSALALAVKMWGSTAHARVERDFWDVGLRKIYWMILTMLSIKKVKVQGRVVNIPRNFNELISIANDWMPMIPRDREQMVNEIILRLQTDAMSIDTALERFGDVADIEDEKEKIQKWVEWKSEIMQQQQDGAETSIKTPIADSGVEDEG